MEKREIKTVAILGGGPAGSAAGIYLARKGLDVVMFADGKRPPLIVGESLVPAVIPFLQDLGVEDEVASYSTWKGGATFVYNTEYRLNIWFDEVRGGGTPTYSYNVPRDRFDTTILDAAARAGVTVIKGKGKIEREGDSQRMKLSAESLDAAEHVLHGSQPDWIIDAMGRNRGIPKLLDLAVEAGDRRDTALHAHIQGVEVEISTNVHTDRLSHGWCWRIPLPGRVSVGFILDSDFARSLGATNEEQFDTFMKQDPVMSEWSKSGRRVSPVIKYNNYQARVNQGFGENWALVGDSFGFVDPVFSSGMLIALQSAKALSEAIADGSPRAFEEYEAYVKTNLDCWRNVIAHFYDGRLLTLFKLGQHVQQKFWGKMMSFHFRKHMPRIFTGDDVTNRYSTWLIEFMSTYGIYGHDPEEYRIL